MITSTELEQGRRYIEETRTGVSGATHGLSGEQWTFKPAPERWSIAEIVEHVVIVQELVLGPIMERLANAPAAGHQDAAQVDTIILNQFPDRTLKVPAPEALQPTGRWAPPAARDRLLGNHDRLIGYLESAPDLRRRRVESPPLKIITQGAYELMDGYQWILALGAHTKRHTAQILEVKDNAGFPNA